MGRYRPLSASVTVVVPVKGLLVADISSGCSVNVNSECGVSVIYVSPCASDESCSALTVELGIAPGVL